MRRHQPKTPEPMRSTLRNTDQLRTPHSEYHQNRLRVFRRWHDTTALRHRGGWFTCMDYIVCACGSLFWEGGGTHVYTISIVRVIHRCGKKWAIRVDSVLRTCRYRLWVNTYMDNVVCACGSLFWEGDGTHVYTISIVRVIHRCRKIWVIRVDYVRCTCRYRLWVITSTKKKKNTLQPWDRPKRVRPKLSFASCV